MWLYNTIEDYSVFNPVSPDRLIKISLRIVIGINIRLPGKSLVSNKIIPSCVIDLFFFALDLFDQGSADRLEKNLIGLSRKNLIGLT